jgi:hypothetical protein
MNIRHFRDEIIQPTLNYVGANVRGFASQSAVELLLGTAAQESNFEHLVQLGNGPAVSLYQIEPNTYLDLNANYLSSASRRDLAERVHALKALVPADREQLIGNLMFATAIARLIYWRSPVSLAAPGDIAGHAHVWKKVYNTPLGKGREADFISNYQRLVAPYI